MQQEMVKQKAEEKNMTPEEREGAEVGRKIALQIMTHGGAGTVIWAVLSLVCGIVIATGGVTMLSARAYALSALAALLASLPCSSPCCPIGAIGGIWALAVLMRPDVKAAFR